MTQVAQKFVNEVQDVRTVIGIWDFGTQGGAQGNINLIGVDGQPMFVGDNIIFTNMFIETVIPLVSNSTTNIEIQGPGAAYTILNGVDQTTFSAPGVFPSNQIVSGDPSTYTRNSSPGTPYISIINDDLTAGQLFIYIQYVQTKTF